MSNRKRTIKEDKKLLNLYIRYRRDYLKDDDFKNMKALTEENHKKIKLYFEPLQFNNKDHKWLSDEYKDRENKIKNEKDGRKRKTLKKELNKLKPYKERYDEIVKIQSRIKHKNRILSKIETPYDNKESIDTNPEAYNYIYDSFEESDMISINDIIINPKDILEFDYHLHLLRELFGLDQSNTKIINVLLTLLPIQMEEGDISDYYTEKVYRWIEKSKRIDDAVKYLISSKYINLSNKKALKIVTNENAKWLLIACLKYEERNNVKITIKRDKKNLNIKSKILHQIFRDYFNLKTAETITKYSSLI
jgi:hypothetical protein